MITTLTNSTVNGTTLSNVHTNTTVNPLIGTSSIGVSSGTTGPYAFLGDTQKYGTVFCRESNTYMTLTPDCTIWRKDVVNKEDSWYIIKFYNGTMAIIAKKYYVVNDKSKSFSEFDTLEEAFTKFRMLS